MSARIRRAIAAMESARPASGYRPETEAEWQKLLSATEEFSYALYREGGMPEHQAREVARLMHSGTFGMFMLRAAFGDDENG